MSTLQTLLIIFGLLNLPFALFLYVHSNHRSAIAFYSLISVFASLWSICTFLTAADVSPVWIRYAFDGHYIFGYLAYLSFFWFAVFFPERPKKRWPVVLAALVTLPTIVFLFYVPTSPLLIEQVRLGSGIANRVVFNPVGYPAFILMLSLIFSLGLVVLVWKLRHSSTQYGANHPGSRRIYFTILSNLTAGTLGIGLNLILPLYGNFSLFYINPILVTLALIGIGFYNLLKFHLFDTKVVLAEFFAASICILSFVRILSSTSTSDFETNAVVFVASVFFGLLLVNSVLHEVTQREKIEKLATELQQTNDRQETLIHFIGHEVKGYLTKSSNTFASLSENDLGPLPEALKPWVDRALADSRRGVTSVESILKAANLKKGTVSYTKAPFDLKALAAEAVEKAKQAATEKKLDLTFTADEGAYEMNGDKLQISEHVLRNLIDNSINYTPSGSVNVSLKREGNKLFFAVKDTGIGITEEDKKRLFTEGGHGANSIKVNAHSTGYGLYIAKQITEAHSGTIRAESEGSGKGSTFIAEFPAK